MRVQLTICKLSKIISIRALFLCFSALVSRMKRRDGSFQLLDVQSFTSQLTQNVNHLDIKEKKKILRLLVKEIVVGDDIIDIRHSIPLKEAKNELKDKSYQLCTRSNKSVTCEPIPASCF